MINVITSKNNPKVKFVCSLKQSKIRKKEKLFLAETFKALEMAIINHQVVEVFTLLPLDIDESIPQYIVNSEILGKISNNINPEGVVFIAKMKEFEVKEYDKILYLDHVSDPGNVGTLIRTALAFSYDLVVSSKDSCSFYNEKVVNSSKGAIFAIPILEETSLKNIKKDHMVIASTLAKDSIDFNTLDVPNKFILVVGNESRGISTDIIYQADIKVIIPIKNIDSLNVAIAGGILMNKIH